MDKMTEIRSGLWIGAHSCTRNPLKQSGFTMLVLSSWQRPMTKRPQDMAKLIRAGLHDHCYIHRSNGDPDLPEGDRELAERTAKTIQNEIEQGGKVLITGWRKCSRPGWIAALTLRLIEGSDGSQAIKEIQDKRENALRNMLFQKHVTDVDLSRLRDLPFE